MQATLTNSNNFNQRK